MKIIVFGLSISSAWGNGHASTFRSLLAAVARRGHDILFLERDVPWYAEHRDLPHPAYLRLELYDGLEDLEAFVPEIETADLVVVGSYVPEGARVIDLVRRTARGVRAFYDIDTPVTLASLDQGDSEYVRRAQIPELDLYLSFSGGPVLDRLERQFGAARARPLYCSVEPSLYHPVNVRQRWHLGYLGTYSDDRQPGLERRLLEPARRSPETRFVVAGAQFPPDVVWPVNVERVEHIAPAAHPAFFCAQRFTLNLTRQAMIQTGYSPSVRLFEAAACGVPIISDSWPGLEAFFVPGREILVTESAEETLELVIDLPEEERRRVAERARTRVMNAHTADHRALELEQYVREVCADREGASVA
jgi:spore maturation protein CgeB